jgi:hypothetical protein
LGDGPGRCDGLSADGDSVIVGTEDGGAVAGRWATAPPTSVAALGSSISTAQLSADGAVALVATSAGAGTIRSVASGAELLPLSGIFTAALDPAGQHVAVARVDGQPSATACTPVSSTASPGSRPRGTGTPAPSTP